MGHDICILLPFVSLKLRSIRSSHYENLQSLSQLRKTHLISFSRTSLEEQSAINGTSLPDLTICGRWATLISFYLFYIHCQNNNIGIFTSIVIFKLNDILFGIETKPFFGLLYIQNTYLYFKTIRSVFLRNSRAGVVFRASTRIALVNRDCLVIRCHKYRVLEVD